jgi:hypothetical protein
VIAIGLPPGALPKGAPFGDGPMGIGAVIEDGNFARRGGDVTSVEILRQLGLVAGPLPGGLVEFASPPITDPRGEVAGRVRPAFRLG